MIPKQQSGTVPGVKRRIRKETLYGYGMASPAILGFLIFTMGPLLASLYLSFTDYSITNDHSFVGLDNFRRLFTGEDSFFYKSLFVTFYYVILAVPFSLLAAFAMAMLLKNKVRGRSMFRAVFYLPSIVPVVATSTIFIWLLNPDIGLFNQILSFLHLPTSLWIYDEATVVPTMAFMNIWSVGGTMLIFLAGLESIPDHYYEAVDIDGGGMWHKLTAVTLPMLTPTIFFNLVMGVINGFQSFSEAYIMTEGGPNNASLFYVVYLYREAFTNQRMGSASAIAWVLFAIILVLSLIIFRSSKSWVYYEGEK
ncbi:ABC transporter permease [Paenibacillus sp. 598K]|uniref:carbohydrate ABC transporter permease n=1 Tax=Paenibacillus sp. 598K TaxID=1117987 RepID=UPI000FFAADB9|nr:sugar ABC transporter permease [Paenibacillus sp. 598K]GBF77722.1 ABC transporter permease [Paenibacillus sp. 598K]